MLTASSVCFASQRHLRKVLAVIWSVFRAYSKETAEEGKPQVRATHAAAAVHEDAIGAGCGLRYLLATIFSANAVEESDGEGGAASAAVVGRSTGERSEEAVEGAVGNRVGLLQQFVKQVVCVLRTELSGAGALRSRCKGSVRRPGT
jgi:hypothetical protein